MIYFTDAGTDAVDGFLDECFVRLIKLRFDSIRYFFPQFVVIQSHKPKVRQPTVKRNSHLIECAYVGTVDNDDS